MYLDGVVILSLVIVTLTCAMIIYVGVYAYKHIKAEIALEAGSLENNGK